MTGFEAALHPVFKDLQYVSDALLLGAAEEIAYWGLLKGVYVEYIDQNSTTEGTSYLRMDQGGWRVVEYQFSPAGDIANPLTVKEDDGGVYNDLPVFARLIVQVNKPPLIRIGKRSDGTIAEANAVQIDVVDNGMIFSTNEAVGIRPFLGSYDSEHYRYISSKTYEELRLGHVLQFTKEFLRNN